MDDSESGHVQESPSAHLPATIAAAFAYGLAIPAHPLVLTKKHQIDERRQRALSRYYLAAGADGLAVGVHTTQFAIRDPGVALYHPVLELAAEEMDRADANRSTPVVRIGGICGKTTQALAEAGTLRDLDYHIGLLSLAALPDADDDALITHCRAVAEVIPLMGFYLQSSVGGRPLPYSFWRRFVEIERIVGIKISPFNRYQTIDVVRAVVEAGRDDIALYTGNDDHILMDLLTPFRFDIMGSMIERRIVGGLLGHWAVWTQKAVEQLERCRQWRGQSIDAQTLALANDITDANAAIFDVANAFHGCVPGIHEVLRRQGLIEEHIYLDPNECLSAGQADEIDRVSAAYPHLNDDEFVAAHRNEWLSG